MPVALIETTKAALLLSPLWRPLCDTCDQQKLVEAGLMDFESWSHEDWLEALFWATQAGPEDPLPPKIEAHFKPLRRKGKA